MIFFLKTVKKIILNHTKERWLGYILFLFIFAVSFFNLNSIILQLYLKANFYYSLAIVFIGILLFILSEISKNFHEIVLLAFRSIRNWWLLQSDYELVIKDFDSREVIKKKVNRYVDQEAAKQEKAFEKWKIGLKFKKPVTHGRPVFVFLFGIGTFAIVGILFENSLLTIEELLKSSSLANLFTIFISAPVAFLIWKYRDQNNLWQIENNRKDINLKDFQRLSELACGTHFPEDKVRDFSYDQRRHAAKSLQVAAIYQLKEFMEGAYGSQFTRPTFLLLASIWDDLVDQDHEWWVSWAKELSKNKFTEIEKKEWIKKSNEVRKKYAILFSKPVGFALQDTLFGNDGYRLRLNELDLRDSLFTGVNQNSQGMRKIQVAKQNLIGICWNGANLAGVEWLGTDLSYSQLLGADLSNAKLMGVNLSFANLHGAMLAGTLLQGAFLHKAKFKNADLCQACLEAADCREAVFYGANLTKASFKFADLRGADFQNAHLNAANLIGADLRECKIGFDDNNKTDLSRCVIDLNTKFESDEVRQHWIQCGAKIFK